MDVICIDFVWLSRFDAQIRFKEGLTCLRVCVSQLSTALGQEEGEGNVHQQPSRQHHRHDDPAQHKPTPMASRSRGRKVSRHGSIEASRHSILDYLSEFFFYFTRTTTRPSTTTRPYTTLTLSPETHQLNSPKPLYHQAILSLSLITMASYTLRLNQSQWGQPQQQQQQGIEQPEQAPQQDLEDVPHYWCPCATCTYVRYNSSMIGLWSAEQIRHLGAEARLWKWVSGALITVNVSAALLYVAWRRASAP